MGRVIPTIEKESNMMSTSNNIMNNNVVLKKVNKNDEHMHQHD
jgi:hypothetical protein